MPHPTCLSHRHADAKRDDMHASMSVKMRGAAKYPVCANHRHAGPTWHTQLVRPRALWALGVVRLCTTAANAHAPEVGGADDGGDVLQGKVGSKLLRLSVAQRRQRQVCGQMLLLLLVLQQRSNVTRPVRHVPVCMPAHAHPLHAVALCVRARLCVCRLSALSVRVGDGRQEHAPSAVRTYICVSARVCA